MPTPPHRPRHGGAIPASRLLDFIDPTRLDRLLAPLLTEPADRRFVARCLVDEGPLHHRGANYVLLALLGRLVAERGASPSADDSTAVPMRLPPHLAETLERSDYPLRLPLGALRELAGGDEQALAAMVDCLSDGPPQHALANVAMVALLDALLRSR